MIASVYVPNAARLRGKLAFSTTGGWRRARGEGRQVLCGDLNIARSDSESIRGAEGRRHRSASRRARSSPTCSATTYHAKRMAPTTIFVFVVATGASLRKRISAAIVNPARCARDGIGLVGFQTRTSDHAPVS